MFHGRQLWKYNWDRDMKTQLETNRDRERQRGCDSQPSSRPALARPGKESKRGGELLFLLPTRMSKDFLEEGTPTGGGACQLTLSND
ncbi:hypothetical protein DdX_06354 [Ditylenchus destructor]|uniref:Uncharacterized protein n=1 Tax=Ditylenchus destructor TaxID=166010 RepID=A0AAD4N7H3_9BILA|nr:hypothetical protein DdX_06354 [Ditylenchus destructor]